MSFTVSEKIYHAASTVRAVEDMLLEGLSRDIFAVLEAKEFPITATSYSGDNHTITLTFGGTDNESVQRWDAFRASVFQELDLVEPDDPTEETVENSSSGSGNKGHITLNLELVFFPGK